MPSDSTVTRSQRPLSLQQAADASPTLARLTQQVRESTERLQAVESLFPPSLRNAVQAGPIDGTNWCLLVEGSSAAAKIRQMLPLLQERLRDRGWEVTSIRLKVQTR